MSVHTKTENKKPHNNWKSVSLWRHVFRELWDSHSVLLGCATVRTLETEVINHTQLQMAFIVTDFVQKQKTAYATQQLVTQQSIFSRSVHTGSSLLQRWISTTFTSCNFILLSLGSLNWDSNKNTAPKEDNFQKDRKCNLPSSSYTHSGVAEVLDFSHFYKNKNV